MKYDDASWHYGGDFPPDLPAEAGGTHIGMFVTWCLLNGLSGEIHTNDLSEELKDLKEHRKTPGAWFLENCDEKFTDEDLNEEGNRFAQEYYDSDEAPYLEDYEAALGESVESLYHATDSWDFYERLAPLIAKRFENWRIRNG